MKGGIRRSCTTSSAKLAHPLTPTAEHATPATPKKKKSNNRVLQWWFQHIACTIHTPQLQLARQASKHSLIRILDLHCSKNHERAIQRGNGTESENPAGRESCWIVPCCGAMKRKLQI